MWDGPWYNTTISYQLHGYSFEKIFQTVCKHRYNIMCAINSDVNIHKKNDNSSSGGVRPLPNHSTTDDIEYIGLTLNFIEN